MTSRKPSDAVGFFDFISSIVTTFEGDDLEMCYGPIDKPKCLSDLLKIIFDTRTDVRYCWSSNDANPCDETCDVCRCP